MSLLSIRQALEVALAAVPGGPCGWENDGFKPPAGPYRRAWLLPAEPDNSENSGNYIAQGVFQVNVCYPAGSGPAAATTEAELIADKFKRASTFTRGGQSVIVAATPYIAAAMQDNDRYVVPVRISYRSFVRG